jgi:hypothetical protein
MRRTLYRLAGSLRAEATENGSARQGLEDNFGLRREKNLIG